MKNQVYQSVNFHLLDACNMQCKFCFATFNDIERVNRETQNAISIINQLAEYGFKKITFAGGEPTLRSDLPKLLQSAKRLGMTTMLVTNGSRLLEPGYFENIKNDLDWLVLSIDSLNVTTNLSSGRFVKKAHPIQEEEYLELCSMAHGYGIRLKINTVVSRFNYTENLSAFIIRTKAERWKVFQALPVRGQNDEHQGSFEITTSEYQNFLERHVCDELSAILIPEDNEAITGSYIMVAPNGCFFDDTKGYHTYSDPILKVGVAKALTQISFDQSKFESRGGLYPW